MTSVRWAVFGESGSDKTFLEALLRHLGMTGIEIETIEGGVSHLRHVATQIRRRGDSGRRVALLLDANNQPEKRRKEAVQEVERLDLPVSRIILLPSDEQPGDLETVLEGLAVARRLFWNRSGRPYFPLVKGDLLAAPGYFLALRTCLGVKPMTP